MKAVILIALLLSTPCFALDIGKLLNDPKNVEQMNSLLMQQLQKDRSCPVLLNPDARLKQWQLDLNMLKGIMQIAQTRISTTVDANTLATRTEAFKLYNQSTTLKLIIKESQDCLLKSIDWTDLCSNSHPSLAGQCGNKIDFGVWLKQDWLCEEKTEQCEQKLAQLQATQQSSRQLAEWALDSASAVNPKLGRSAWQQLLGFEPAQSQ